jgi:predicted choloylglycine hydrolase
LPEPIPFTFRATAEALPGDRWQAFFAESWPWYRRWFLREGDAARPSYVTSRRMLETHLPELVATYDRLVELAGGGDVAARMLSMYRPPPYLAGCSQGAFTAGEPTLVRNYDYAPSRLEGVTMLTAWTGRRVIGMSDCLWGLLDGMNDAGLAVSLTFGGRTVLGDGFGIPLIVRYLLETCDTVQQACATLERLPFSLAHNLTLLDAGGDAVTAYVAPDRAPRYRSLPVATNHQGDVEWPEHARFTRTVERERHVEELLADPAMTPARFEHAFLDAPLFSTAYSRGFGTLYTAVYRPRLGTASFLWPGTTWHQSFAAFTEGTHTQPLVEVAVA